MIFNSQALVDRCPDPVQGAPTAHDAMVTSALLSVAAHCLAVVRALRVAMQPLCYICFFPF